MASRWVDGGDWVRRWITVGISWTVRVWVSGCGLGGLIRVGYTWIFHCEAIV